MFEKLFTVMLNQLFSGLLKALRDSCFKAAFVIICYYAVFLNDLNNGAHKTDEQKAGEQTTP